MIELEWRGRPIQICAELTEETLDWSGCRSPARARCRHAHGHPQRVIVSTRPSDRIVAIGTPGEPADFYLMHPDRYQEIQIALFDLVLNRSCADMLTGSSDSLAIYTFRETN